MKKIKHNLLKIFILLSVLIASIESKWFPDLEDCTRFYTCLDGGESCGPHSCPEGLFFDELNQTCNISDELCDVEETTTSITTTTTDIVTTTEEITTATDAITTTTEKITTTEEIPPTTTDSIIHEDCIDMENSDDIIFFPSKTDCASYYFCYNGQPQEMTCIAGMYWNQAQMRCDWSENVECLPTTTATPEICPDSGEPIFVQSTTNCEEYYLCYKGTPQLLRCADDMHWNQETLQCDYPENANCTINGLPMCPTTGVHFYPHPQKCTQYISCYYGKQEIVNCPFNEHWDIIQNKCITENLATCILD